MKLKLFTAFAAAGFLLAGCAVEEAPMAGGSIAAVMEDIQTRTAVTDEGIFTWSSGDKVWLEITANPGYVTGTLSTGAGTGSANFSYGTYFGDMTGKAVYPFNAGHDINGDELSVVLPPSYDLGSNISNTNAAMYGVETNGSIKFNHLAGVMRFKFRNVPVGTDKFILTLDKKINGTFTADLTEDHPALQTESTSVDSEKSITLNFDALTSVQDIMLYVPLPLGTYTTLGLEVKAGSQSVWSYSNTVTNTINRKSLILMPTVTLAGSISGDIEGSETPEDPSEPDSSQPSYSLQLNPSTYGWQQSTTVPNPDASLYDGVYESTNQGLNDTKSIMYIDIDGYYRFTIYVRSNAQSKWDYVEVSNLDVDITSSTSGFKMTTSGNQNSGTSLSSYTAVTFTNIGGGQHRIMVIYRKDVSQSYADDKGYVLIPKNQGSQTPDGSQDGDYIDEYGVNHGQGVEIDGVVWAPVNCGYHETDYKYGKLYQWGRKYGQGYEGDLCDVNYIIGAYTDASVPSIISGPVSLATGQSESNSNKFYYNYSYSSPCDWVTPQDDMLWNSGTESNPVKTDYDPCPEGWRVPTYAELINLRSNYSFMTTNGDQSGRWFSGSSTYSSSVSRVFFPAAGYRDADGSTYYRGSDGRYWSSSPDGSDKASDLYFLGGTVNVYSGGRAYGYSVRCVQVTD